MCIQLLTMLTSSEIYQANQPKMSALFQTIPVKKNISNAPKMYIQKYFTDSSSSQVGAQSCGKTSLMQLLATLLGKELIILSMNSDMDTTELLGGFEQVHTLHHVVCS